MKHKNDWAKTESKTVIKKILECINSRHYHYLSDADSPFEHMFNLNYRWMYRRKKRETHTHTFTGRKKEIEKK